VPHLVQEQQVPGEDGANPQPAQEGKKKKSQMLPTRRRSGPGKELPANDVRPRMMMVAMTHRQVFLAIKIK